MPDIDKEFLEVIKSLIEWAYHLGIQEGLKGDNHRLDIESILEQYGQNFQGG